MKIPLLRDDMDPAFRVAYERQAHRDRGLDRVFVAVLFAFMMVREVLR